MKTPILAVAIASLVGVGTPAADSTTPDRAVGEVLFDFDSARFAVAFLVSAR